MSVKGGSGATGRPVHRGVACIRESRDLAVEPKQRAQRGREGAGVLGDEQRDVVPLVERVGVGPVESTHPAAASATVERGVARGAAPVEAEDGFAKTLLGVAEGVTVAVDGRRRAARGSRAKPEQSVARAGEGVAFELIKLGGVAVSVEIGHGEGVEVSRALEGVGSALRRAIAAVSKVEGALRRGRGGDGREGGEGGAKGELVAVGGVGGVDGGVAETVGDMCGSRTRTEIFFDILGSPHLPKHRVIAICASLQAIGVSLQASLSTATRAISSTPRQWVRRKSSSNR